MHHDDAPVELRILKLTKDVGEAAEALIGLHGHSRKGVWRTRDDPLDELADVIVTAAMAMSAVADNQVDHAPSHFKRRLEAVITRAGL